MKKKYSIILISILFSITVFGQAAGELTFSCNTTAPSGNWGNKHVLAIWIEDAGTSSFIKTNKKLGSEDDHLTRWRSKSSSNLVDAVTGATPSSYGIQSIIWDGTDKNHNVVPDGDYNIYIEIGWGKNKTDEYALASFTFTKNELESTITPSSTSNFTDININWKPTVSIDTNHTSVSEIDITEPNAYPNPCVQYVNININQPIESGIVKLQNITGRTVLSQKLDPQFTGVYSIDTHLFPEGIYFLKLSGNEKRMYVFKVLITK